MKEMVVIISGRQMLPEFKAKVETKYSVQEARKGLLIQDKAGKEVAIKENNSKGRQRYASMGDVPGIVSRLDTLFFYYVHYERNRLFKELSQLLFDDEELMVDLSAGFIIDGKQFTGAMQYINNPSDEVENESGVSFYSSKAGVRNDVCFKHVSFEGDFWDLFLGKLSLSKPLKMKIRSGKKFNDIVYFYGEPINFAISERLRQLLIEAGVTGWSTYDLDVEGCDRLYHGFIVTGRCAAIPPKNTNEEVRGYPIKGWDGSDFFTPENSATLFCTQQVTDLYLKHDIRRVDIIDSRDMVRY